MENKLLQNKKLLLALIILLSVFLIIIFYFVFSPPQNNILIIDNLDKQIHELPVYRKDDLQKILYSYINEQNKINGIKNENVYHGIIRDGSTETVSTNITADVYTTSFILDVAKLQYSYEVQFSWVKEDLSEDLDIGIDLGSTAIYCLSEEDSIYPYFNCDKNPIISIKTDSLLSTNMVISKDCWMSPFSSVESKSGYGINIFYHPVDDDYKNNTIDSSYNACVETAKQSLVSNGLNLNNYKIKSEIKYFYNY